MCCVCWINFKIIFKNNNIHQFSKKEFENDPTHNTQHTQSKISFLSIIIYILRRIRAAVVTSDDLFLFTLKLFSISLFL